MIYIQVKVMSSQLIPKLTSCSKDAVLCGIDYTTEGRRLADSMTVQELKQYFYR